LYTPVIVGLLTLAQIGGPGIRDPKPRGLISATRRTVQHEYAFTRSGALFTDDSNTKCHLYWDSAGVLQDTKGCAWVANGSPASVNSPLFTDGFSGTAKKGVGPLDDTNNLKLGTGNDVLDITTGTICALFSITQASDGTYQQNIYSNHDGARGWRIFVHGSNTSKQICATWAPSGSTPCGSLAPLDGPFLACIGHDGTNGYSAFSADTWTTVTTSAPQAPTAAVAYLGRLSTATGAPGNVKIHEFWVTSTLPSAVNMRTLFTKVYGHGGTTDNNLILRRTTAGTYTVNGTSWNSGVSFPRVTEKGIFLDTDWVRAPRGYGIGSGSGGMQFTYTPNYASNAAGDKILVSDGPWNGNNLANPAIEVRYVAASDKFQLKVGATTVLSAVQSFSADTPINISWYYQASGQACLVIGVTTKCAALTTVIPGAALSFGGNLYNTYSSGYWKHVGFYAGAGTLPVSVAALGDSITEGHFGDSARITYPEKLGAALGTGYQVDNHGVVGDTAGGAKFRYDAYIRGRGYRYVVLNIGINDIMTLNQTGAVVYANWEILAEEIRTDGLILIATTVLPFKGNAAWTAGKQTQLDALNTSILAYCVAHPTVRCVDGYSDLEDPGSPDELLTAYSHDDLHLTAAGHAELVVLFSPKFP
jgi:lysophospholipase L1-like esterase